MKKKYFLPLMVPVIFFICFPIKGSAQNLVLNPSFENYTSCPVSISQFNLCVDWISPWIITTDTCSTPDLYNSCCTTPASFGGVGVPNNLAGYRPAHSGNGYAGFIAYSGGPSCMGLGDGWREYVEGHLSSPLVAGQEYCVSFYVSLPYSATYAVKNMGVYFSNSVVTDSCTAIVGDVSNLPYTPQLQYTGGFLSDTTGWTRLQWNYTATGGEQYLTIGNFNNDANTSYTCSNSSSLTGVTGYAYYFIDDVSVIPGACCAVVSPAGPFCTTDPPDTLVTTLTGGTWSGTGITNASLGIFSPSVAGPGTHQIIYAIGCGNDTIYITVNPCATLTVCLQTNDSLTVSGGTGPYTWQYLTTTIDCSSCPLGQCIPFICTGTVIQTWTTFSTGTTVSPPTPVTDTIRVMDVDSNKIVIDSIGALLSCSPCPTLTVTQASLVGVKCFGDSTGSFSASTTGGTSPYNYSLVNSSSITVDTYNNIAGSQSFTGLPAGTYTLNVTDHNGCPGTVSVTITQPSSSVSASITGSTPPSCDVSNGSATVTGSGGTGSYTYLWSTSPTHQTTPTASNLLAGVYTVTVTDVNGCTASATVTLTNPNAPVLSTTTVNATCGMSNGSAMVTATGGTAPYTYLWSTSPAQTTSTAGNLAPGTYYVTVTDRVSCTSIDTAIVIDTSSFSAHAGPNQSICKGESATLTATGGTIYQWSTAASSATINVTPSVTTMYTVTVSNSYCTATANVTVTVNAIPVAVITGDTLICQGTPIILTASGGTSYVWSNSDTIAAITVSPLGPTTYNVTVTSAGCSSTASISLNLLTPPTANAGHDTTINIGGSVQLHGSGGVSFSWSPDGTLSCSTCADPMASPLSTMSYILVVTGANGCKSSDTVTVTVEVNCGDVFVPNAFSPNNDGKNELECVYGNCIKSMEFSVYDRWGEKVFTSTDAKVCWDGTYNGKKLNTGVFVYYLKATLYNGSEISKKGNINLFR
jgi:gliding motility-associated-like protein